MDSDRLRDLARDEADFAEREQAATSYFYRGSICNQLSLLKNVRG
jgi:hypothetical protein